MLEGWVMKLICPICGDYLQKNEHTCVCPKGHSFDIARQGYVNLLTVQQKHSLNPGDTKEQVASRREFLSADFYAADVGHLHYNMYAVSCRNGRHPKQICGAYLR